jgi:hypothetical protein
MVRIIGVVNSASLYGNRLENNKESNSYDLLNSEIRVTRIDGIVIYIRFSAR